MATRVIGGGLEVDGLSQAIRKLKDVSPQLRAEAVDVMRDAAKDVQKRSQARIGRGQYRLPKGRGMIGRSATSTGAGVKLRAKKYPWALAAEYGDRVWNVYATPGDRNAYRQTRLRQPVANPHKPPTSTDLLKNKGGYLIQPTIRAEGQAIIDLASRRLFVLITKNLGRRRG